LIFCMTFPMATVFGGVPGWLRPCGSLLRRRALAGGDGFGEALGEVLGGAGLRGIEVEVGDRGGRRQLDEELVDLALGEVALAERRAIEAAGRRREAVGLHVHERAQ